MYTFRTRNIEKASQKVHEPIIFVFFSKIIIVKFAKAKDSLSKELQEL